ncbi:MAG TPA: Holliday junction resolvase RuvX [Gemmatimonadaceae bacterium]|nr:Holliday junction resolvase RuvX [Gemmatimonadaceae bacterium]
MSRLGRYLAVDWGERRIGLAASDPTGTIASPAGHIVRRAGKRPPIAELIRRAEALDARGFVVGLPLDEQGGETDRSREVRAAADALGQRTGLPVLLVDERYTTAIALRAVRELGGDTRGRKGDIDSLAATVLLQHAMRSAELTGERNADPESDPGLPNTRASNDDELQ